MQVRYQAAPRPDRCSSEVKSDGVYPVTAPLAGGRETSSRSSPPCPAAARRTSIATAPEALPPPRETGRACARLLPPEDLHQFLELEPDLLDDLLALGGVSARLLTGELVARATDCETLVVQEAADLADDDHILALVIATVAPALHRLELWEFLLPVAQHMWLDPAQVTHFTDGEVPLAGDRRQLGVILWLQHRLRRAPLVFVRAGTSPRGGR